jgi:hypothetical protein
MDAIPSPRLLLIAAIAFPMLTGCSMLSGRNDPSPESAAQAERIDLYEAAPPGARDYRFVSRLWVEPRQSAARVPRYASVEAGVADLRNRAVDLGGDAIVNFACFHSDVDPKSDYYCNGTVIKYVQ